jgi:hypothetical protein
MESGSDTARATTAMQVALPLQRANLCRVATPTCWGGMTANRRRQLTATTRPGSVALKRRFDPDRVFAAIPLPQGSRPVLLRLKRIPCEL